MTTTTTTTTTTMMKWVSGTDLVVGNTMVFPTCQMIIGVTPGTLDAGGRYIDVDLTDGTSRRCWSNFMYKIKLEKCRGCGEFFHAHDTIPQCSACRKGS